MIYKACIIVLLASFVNSATKGEADPYPPEICGLQILQPETSDEIEIEEPETESKLTDLPAEADLVKGDMIFSKQQAKEFDKKAEKNDARKRAAIKNSQARGYQRWTPHQPVYYAFHAQLPENLQTRIKRALKTIEEYTCIEFEKVDDNEEDQRKFHITYTKVIGTSSSYVGKQERNFNQPEALNLRNGRRKNFQEIILNGGSFGASIIHETMHALGFIHEQERPDRDTYINVYLENVRPAKKKNFDKMPADLVSTFDEPYDFNSIMHYKKTYMAKTGEDGKKLTTMEAKLYYSTGELHLNGQAREIGSKGSLTRSDVRRLNKLFECKTPPEPEIKQAIKRGMEKIKVLSEDKKTEKKLIQKEDIIDGFCELYSKFNKKLKA